jgi:CheY-like chemotaxis protein
MGSEAAPDEVAGLQPRAEAESMSVDVPAGRVLVVDDDPLNRMLLTRSLEQEGHRVGSVAGGQEALEILRQKPFDVVLLDIVMPELDGVSVVERLKRDPVLQYLPVIIISAVEEIDCVVRCIEMGSEDYLPKPFNQVLLRDLINAALA